MSITGVRRLLRLEKKAMEGGRELEDCVGACKETLEGLVVSMRKICSTGTASNLRREGDSFTEPDAIVRARKKNARVALTNRDSKQPPLS